MKLAFEITIALKEDRSNRSCFSSTFSASFFFSFLFFFSFFFLFLFLSRDKERDRFLLKHHKVGKDPYRESNRVITKCT